MNPPPIGLVPRKFIEEARYREVVAAIERYNEARMLIPNEWAEELAYLTERLNSYA